MNSEPAASVPSSSRRVKNVLDRIVAGLALVLLVPLLLVLALLIRVCDGGPVLFTQRRVGRDGALFTMRKFRTMVNGAIEIGQQMKITEDPFGIVRNDPRITRLGRFLRRTSFDELPQLFNVVRGEMSLVGPRPDVPEQAVHYTVADRRRLAVKPGITGWAQVNGREDLPWSQRFELDAWYVKHWSLALDGKILWMTISEIGRSEPNATPDEVNILRRKGVADGK